MSGQNITDAIQDMMNIPDSFFKASTGREMINEVLKQIDVQEMARIQAKEFRDNGMSYAQVVVACAEMQREIRDLIEAFEEQDIIAAKKVFLQEIFSKFLDLPEYLLKDYPKYDAEIPTELCHPNAKLPIYVHESDAGADVFAVENTSIVPGETKLLPTGLKMAIPKGWMISPRPRSGVSLKTSLRIANAPGTVDSGFLQEIGIIIDNIGNEDIQIKQGDRIAQLILERAYKAEFVPTNDVTKHTTENRANESGEQGFGSTGVK